MSGHHHVLAIYSSISAKTGEMLDAARVSDWERLIALEQDCRALVEALKRVEVDTTDTDSEYLEHKAEFIHKVLADDAEIRKLTEPWMTQLGVYLGSACQEQRLHRAYETDNGA